MSRADQEGRPCFWCRRAMTRKGTVRNRSGHLAGLRPTRDHWVPKSAGGQRCVWACLACNAVRGDMTVDQWNRFRSQTPSWWTLFEGKGRRGKALFFSNPENADTARWRDNLDPGKRQVAAE